MQHLLPKIGKTAYLPGGASNVELGILKYLAFDVPNTNYIYFNLRENYRTTNFGMYQQMFRIYVVHLRNVSVNVVSARKCELSTESHQNKNTRRQFRITFPTSIFDQ